MLAGSDDHLMIKTPPKMAAKARCGFSSGEGQRLKARLPPNLITS